MWSHSKKKWCTSIEKPQSVVSVGLKKILTSREYGVLQSARSGQTVTRAGSILIMFGGEDAKGRKLNDLHILDLKSLMWLPLHTS